MHVVIGFLIVAGSFALAFRYWDQPFDGFYNLASVILLAGVPIGLTIVTYPFSAMVEGLRGVWWSIARDGAGEQRRNALRIRELARAVRQGRGQQGQGQQGQGQQGQDGDSTMPGGVSPDQLWEWLQQQRG